MIYTLHPGAEMDLRDAAEFYRDRAGTTLSQSFLEEFEHSVSLLLEYPGIEHSVSLLLEYPGIGSPWRCATRRFIMRRFPYSIIYSTASEEIRILAVAHQSRRPGYWRMRK